VEGGALRPLRSVVDFYNAVLGRGPRGARVTVLPGGPGSRGGRRAGVGRQGTDERKPLLSLFVTAGGGPRRVALDRLEPSGPYETSGPEVGAADRLALTIPATPRRPPLRAGARIPQQVLPPGYFPALDRAGEAYRPPAPPPLPARTCRLSFDASADLAGSQIVLADSDHVHAGLERRNRWGGS